MQKLISFFIYLPFLLLLHCSPQDLLFGAEKEKAEETKIELVHDSDLMSDVSSFVCTSRLDSTKTISRSGKPDALWDCELDIFCEVKSVDGTNRCMPYDHDEIVVDKVFVDKDCSISLGAVAVFRNKIVIPSPYDSIYKNSYFFLEGYWYEGSYKRLPFLSYSKDGKCTNVPAILLLLPNKVGLIPYNNGRFLEIK